MSLVVIDRNQEFQTWKFWSAVSRRWQAPHMYFGPNQGTPMDPIPAADKDAILTACYSDLFLDQVDLPIGPQAGDNGSMDPSYLVPTTNTWKSHELANDNTDPNVVKPSGFNWAYWDLYITEVLQPILAKITARGGTPGVTLRFTNCEKWMRATGSAVLSSTKLDEFAEWVMVFINRLKNTYGITVSYISVKNEPVAAGYNAPLVADMAKKLIQKFAAAVPVITTKVMGPETLTPREMLDTSQGGQGYLAHFVSRGIDGQLGGINYHIYDYDPGIPGAVPDNDARFQMRQWANARGLPTFMTELSTDVKPANPNMWKNTPEQAQAWAKDLVNEMVESWMAGFTFMWNVWSGISPVYQQADSFAMVKLDVNRNYLGWELPVFYANFQKFINNIRPGMKRVACSTNDPTLKVVAWKDAVTKKIVTLVVNDDSLEHTVSINGGDFSDSIVVPAKTVGLSMVTYP